MAFITCSKSLFSRFEAAACDWASRSIRVFLSIVRKFGSESASAASKMGRRKALLQRLCDALSLVSNVVNREITGSIDAAFLFHGHDRLSAHSRKAIGND